METLCSECRPSPGLQKFTMEYYYHDIIAHSYVHVATVTLVEKHLLGQAILIYC